MMRLPYAALMIFSIVAFPDPSVGQIEQAADAPKPLSPSQSQQLFKLPQGFHVELVASEPLLADPVAIAFDPRGRTFVCEIHGYNLEGYYDIFELNKTGKLDRAVRRILADPETIRRAEQEQFGTVKVLEDTNGDGRMDRATVWADRLPPCYGVVPARDGVIVLCAPDIVYLADRDGDGKAEIRETLFTGFGVGELWTRINNPRWNPDNWIYAVSGGGSGGTIRGPHLAGEVKLSSVCFRFKPDGTAIEPANGQTHGFGQAVNDWGDRFLCTNQQHALHVAPLSYRYLARNPYHASPNPTVNICSYGHPTRVYPTSKPDPWRTARASDPAWVRFYGTAEATANGYFTAASGQAIYQGTQFPPEFHGNHFSVDNAQNMIHRCLLIPEGSGFTVRRPPGYETREFLTSTEQWFRPTNLLTGPDGSLYVVDMYRAIIEDYSAIPRYLQQLYIESLIGGSDRGRIWRIVADGATRPTSFDMTQASVEELVKTLQSSNFWWRMTAQRLLVQREDRSAIRPLKHMAQRGKTPQARLHALGALDGLDALSGDVVERVLTDSHFAVRMHALRLGERWLDGRSSLLPTVLAMVDDRHPRVRLQLALTLGESDDPRALQALSQLAAVHGNDRWMTSAALSSVTDSAGAMLATLLRNEEQATKIATLIRPLASIVGARRNDDEMGRVLALLADSRRKIPAERQIACLEGLQQGLEGGGTATLKSAAGNDGLRQLLLSERLEVQRLALHLAGRLKLDSSSAMTAAYKTARRVALDASEPVRRRLTAITLLTGAPLSELEPIADQLLDPRQPLDLQLAVIGVLSSLDTPEAGPLLLRSFSAHTPKVRAAVIDAIFRRQNRLVALLDAIERGDVPVSSLDALHRQHLVGNSDRAVAERAGRLLAKSAVPEQRQQLLARYQQALSFSRDAKRGKTVFADQCAKCHKLGDEGFEVGPDLSSARTRTDETLLSDVMDPSNQITVGYNNYSVLTQSGLIVTGVLVAETATSVTLRREEDAEDTILRKDIDEMEASPLSMMPEDLDKEVTPQDIADLIGYLRETFGQVDTSAAVLFEDDPGLIEQLGEGRGVIRLDTAAPFSGKASLAVTPPQRYSAVIAGWRFPIVEKPGPGEYRYLQFAWKQPRGDGLMLELAADGRWPSGETATRRYYSGKNTTGWNATRVSEQRPDKWTLVTVDLWKDFGPFVLTGMAPTAMGGEAFFDRIELLLVLPQQ